MLLSIIIPCYRETRDVLNRALDSLAFLTGLCQWEAWIVDDGSLEGKVQEWVDERHDEHLHVLRQTNQGQATARNNALQHAVGEYVAFLDADDELLPEAFTKVIGLLQEKRPDLIGYRYKPTASALWEGNATAFMAEQDVVPSVCTYIVRRETLGDLRFTPGIYHEDEELVTLLHLRCHTLLMTPYVAYRYHATSGSTMLSHNIQHLQKRFTDLLGVIERTKQRLAEALQGKTCQHTTADSASEASLQTTADSASEHTQKAVAALAAQALCRRLHVMAMCFVVNLITSAPSTSFVKEQLSSLSQLGLYPLPPLGKAKPAISTPSTSHPTPTISTSPTSLPTPTISTSPTIPTFPPIRRYRWIRLLTKKPWLVAMARKLMR